VIKRKKSKMFALSKINIACFEYFSQQQKSLFEVFPVYIEIPDW